MRGGRLRTVTIGKGLYLPSSQETRPQVGSAKITSDGRAVSKLMTLTVFPPERRPPRSALIRSGIKLNTAVGHAGSREGLSFIKVPERNPLPVLLVIYLHTGKAPVQLRLTGDPLVDFRKAQVDGPDGLNGDRLIEKPKPHYRPIPNWNAVPRTAYGSWLVRHKLGQHLKWRKYTLQPGVLYKYAVPVNLACQFDLSIPGTYHVRLGLAGTNVRSAWTDVRIPR